MALINTTPTYLAKAQAENIVSNLNADFDDDWTYQAVPVDVNNPDGYWTVNAYDENDEFAGTL